MLAAEAEAEAVVTQTTAAGEVVAAVLVALVAVAMAHGALRLSFSILRLSPLWMRWSVLWMVMLRARRLCQN